MSLAAITLSILSTMTIAAKDPLPVEPIGVRAKSFPGLEDNGLKTQCLTIRTGLTLFGDGGFGGLSAMRIEDEKAVFLSDAAMVFSADIVRNTFGFITNLSQVKRHFLVRRNGKGLGKARADSEALVISGENIIVSLENHNRFQVFTPQDGHWAEGETLFQDKKNLYGFNAGYEALTRLSDGRLLGITEGTDKNGFAKVVWQQGEEWQVARYRPAEEFRVTEVDVDPQSGDLIILERAFSRLRGPRARFVRVSRSTILPDQELIGNELGRLSLLHGIDNMEGLQVERIEDGRLIAHVVSDDNYNDVQRTVLMGIDIDDVSAACLPSAPAQTSAGQHSTAQ